MTQQSKQLADLFADSSGEPIFFRGSQVLLAKEIALEDRSRAKIIFKKSVPQPVQGICLKVTAAKLIIEGQESSGMVLWTDTAPQEVDIALKVSQRSKKEPVLSVWNCWRGKHGETHAWLANAGLTVKEHGPNHLEFRCSDGPGEPDFDTLVFDLILDSPGGG